MVAATENLSLGLSTYMTLEPYHLHREPWWEKCTLAEGLTYRGLPEAGLWRFVKQRGIKCHEGTRRGNLTGALRRHDSNPRFHRFLELPQELRNEIYRYYFDGIHTRYWHPLGQPPITQICRAIRSDSLPEFFRVLPITVRDIRKMPLEQITNGHRLGPISHFSARYPHDPYSIFSFKQFLGETRVAIHEDIKGFLASPERRFVRSVSLEFDLCLGSSIHDTVQPVYCKFTKKGANHQFSFRYARSKEFPNGPLPHIREIQSRFESAVQERFNSLAQNIDKLEPAQQWSTETVQQMLHAVQGLMDEFDKN